MQEEKEEEEEQEEKEEKEEEKEEEEQEQLLSTPTNKPSYVYILECTDKSTYVGATVDLDHRLRQHNCEIKGGAVQTHRKVAMGHHWRRVCHIKGFPDWKSALQFEWAVKYYSRKIKIKRNELPIQKRILALHKLTNEMDRPTSKSVSYKEYIGGKPVVVWE